VSNFLGAVQTQAGDIILYLGYRFVIYYDTNSWNFTPLAKIKGTDKTHLLKILGKSSVTVELSLEED